MPELSKPKNLLFNGEIDFYHMIQLTRKNPKFLTFEIEDDQSLKSFLSEHTDKVFLFFITKKQLVVPFSKQSLKPRKGDKVVYIEKPLEN